jgi:hypothetical protein
MLGSGQSRGTLFHSLSTLLAYVVDVRSTISMSWVSAAQRCKEFG